MLYSLLMLIILFALIGFAIWLVVTYVPMPAPFKQVLVVLAVLLLVFYAIGVLFGHMPLPVGRF